MKQLHWTVPSMLRWRAESLTVTGLPRPTERRASDALPNRRKGGCSNEWLCGLRGSLSTGQRASRTRGDPVIAEHKDGGHSTSLGVARRRFAERGDSDWSGSVDLRRLCSPQRHGAGTVLLRHLVAGAAEGLRRVPAQRLCAPGAAGGRQGTTRAADSDRCLRRPCRDSLRCVARTARARRAGPKLYPSVADLRSTLSEFLHGVGRI